MPSRATTVGPYGLVNEGQPASDRANLPGEVKCSRVSWTSGRPKYGSGSPHPFGGAENASAFGSATRSSRNHTLKRPRADRSGSMAKGPNSSDHTSDGEALGPRTVSSLP